MTLTARSFALALALAAVPTVSLADGRDPDRSRAVPAPSPDAYGRDRDRHDDDERRWQDRDGRWHRDPDDRFDRWSERERGRHGQYVAWRRAEWRDLRRDFWELERQRDAFYAYHRRPREVRRFERWYHARRVELEQRRDALLTYAYVRR